MYITFSACRNCCRSAIRAQEEGLDPFCEPYAQLSPWLSSLDQSKCGIWWPTAHYKVNRWLLSLARWGQSVISYLCVDKLSELQVFKRRLYLTHLQCKNMIYLLTLFRNNFLNLTFFVVVIQLKKLRTACRPYWVTKNKRCWFAWDVR